MGNSENPGRVTSQNQEDNELPLDERPDTESESETPSVVHVSTPELEEEVEEHITEPKELWWAAKHLEIEKPESSESLELETPLEGPEQQEVVDDPVRMYLHEIGRVHLLTAADEKVLANKMEEGRRISEIKQDYLQKYGMLPSATEIVVAMLRELCQSAPLIRLLHKELDIKPAASFI